jgi:hypothetical protein
MNLINPPRQRLDVSGLVNGGFDVFKRPIAQSRRNGDPFKSVNCATVTDSEI